MAEEKEQKRVGYSSKNKLNNGLEYAKIPPQATELEELVLGAIMIEPKAIEKVLDIIKAESFYKDEHQHIYQAFLDLHINDNPIDIFTVSEQLRKNEKLEKIGGNYYLSTLTGKVANSAHIEYHARIIAQKFLARQLINISSEMQADAFDEKNDIAEVLQKAEAEIFKITQNNQQKDFTQINPVIEASYQRMRKVFANKGELTGVRSGFYDLDKITAGWQRSDLIIVAARPAMGKTAFVLSMAKNMAVDYKIPVALFCLEMDAIQLVNRLITNVTSIPANKIKTGDLDDMDWDIYDHKIKSLQDAPIFIDDSPGLSIFELRSKARRLVKEHDVQIIIIDYLQLMNASGMRFQSREQEISLISRSLKVLARELNIPIIALSQLNRKVEERSNEGKRPQLSDLRESGAIEQDADMVCLIHRPEYYGMKDGKNGEDLRGIAEIIIAKHRNGETGDVSLRFKGEFTRFSNLSEQSFGNGGGGILLESKSNNKPTSAPTITLPEENYSPF